jgi:hypothetical protein
LFDFTAAATIKRKFETVFYDNLIAAAGKSHLHRESAELKVLSEAGAAVPDPMLTVA